MKNAIVDAISVNAFDNVEGVKNVEVITNKGPANCPQLKLTVDSLKTLKKLGYDKGEYELA